TVDYLKPHGALYNLAADDRAVASAIGRAACRTLPCPRVVLLAGSEAIAAAAATGARPVREGFVDRGYLSSGRLAARGSPGASIEDLDEAGRRALRLAVDGRIDMVDGSSLTVDVETLCLHGDGARAAAIAQHVRSQLEARGVEVLSFV